MLLLDKLNKICSKLKWRLRFINASSRVLPDFLIIGASKSGTTSLWNYLVQHPNVIPNYNNKKEIQYYDQKTIKGLSWYKAHFPTQREIIKIEKLLSNGKVCVGEATAGYLFHPTAPAQIKALTPNVKLIALLRNPVTRAYSHYQHELRMNRENLTFEEAIKMESYRLTESHEKIFSIKHYFCQERHDHSYLERGKYYEQLVRWYECFPKEQILVIKSEDFYNNPQDIYKEVLEFIGLPYYEKQEFEKLNQGNYEVPTDANFAHIFKKLGEYFFEENQKLYELMGLNYGWDMKRQPGSSPAKELSNKL